MEINAPGARVTLGQLRAFVAIGRLSSFTQAATLLHTTQPALSARIRELERSLALRLFDRNTRSVALTQAGSDLLPVVGRLLGDLSAVVQTARDVAARQTGRVAVAALPSMASGLVPTAIARFRHRYPGIAVILRDGLADRVNEMVREGEVDFGVAAGTTDARLAFTPMLDDRIVAVLPPGHALAGRRRLRLPMLVDHPLILMDRDSSVRHLVDATFAAEGRLGAPAYEATFMATAVALVRAGLGVTLLPSSAHEVRAARDLLIRPVDHPGLKRTVGVVRLASRSLSPAAQAFVGVLQKMAGAREHRSA